MITARSTDSPKYASASCFKARKTRPESSGAVNSRSPSRHFQSVPMWRLKSPAHRSGRSTCSSLAAAPTTSVPSSSSATTEGVSRSPSAFGIMRGSGRRCEATVDWSLVQAEKWDSKNGSKWRTMPEQMFAYRAATFLARRYCPEVLMGLYTTDELSDIKANDDSKRETKQDPVFVAIEKIKEQPKPEKPVQNKKSEQKKEKRVQVQDKTEDKKIVDKAKEILETTTEVEFVQELADTIRDAKKEGVTSFWLERAMKEVGIEPHKLDTQTPARIEDLQERISIFLG